MSARTLLLRAPRSSAFRHHALGAGIGLAVACQQQRRQAALKFDAAMVAPQQQQRVYSSKKGGNLDPEVMKQISGGSLAGFFSGVIISVFSRTLVLLLGLSFVAVQVASRYGIDLIEQLKLKKKLGDNKVLNMLQKNPTFKLSFAAFFTMAAFMNF